MFQGTRSGALRFTLLAVCIAAFSVRANADPTTRPTTGQVLRLWEARAPRSTGDEPGDIPTITAYVPEIAKANGCAVVICPGGGYAKLVMDHEGSDIARWLNTNGITAFVLKYRIKPYGQPCPLLDGQRAIRTVRFNSRRWGINWKHIGIMGFNAGGHVAASVGTHFDPYIPGSLDPVNGQSCRPDFMLLVYPLISMQDKITHVDSRKNLLGDHPDPKLLSLYSLETQVRDDTPPAFLVAAKPDAIVPVKNSELFSAALKSRKIPCEFLELETGGHGFGLAREDPKIGVWTERCLAWMNRQGFFKN